MDHLLRMAAEELTYSTQSVTSKKRKISEKYDMNFLTHNVDKVYISDKKLLTQLESHVKTTSGTTHLINSCLSLYVC